jgi:RND family efflux transporter MFP subunit
MGRSFQFFIGFTLFWAACSGLSGCSGSGAKAGEKEPPKVTVSRPIKREVRDYAEYTGRTASPDWVQVRARVSGYLAKINFKEGVEVTEGTVLYEIDPRPYKAALDQSRAQVEQQTAQLAFNESVYQRSMQLYQKSSQSLQQLQQDLAARDTTRANLNAAKASLEIAKLNYDWTKVKAPVSGRIGRALVTRGNLVVADQTLLTTVVSQDPMWAYFDVDEFTVLQVQDRIRAGELPTVQSGAKIPVFLRLENEEGWPHKGHVDFVNNQFDPASATLKVRGVFRNPQPKVAVRVLSPGQFVRIRIAISPAYQGLLVAPSAVGTDQNIEFLYVVDEQNKVIRHEVELGSQQDGLQIIHKGLKAGEKVIVQAIQHVYPGMEVNPKLVEMPIPTPKSEARNPKQVRISK